MACQSAVSLDTVARKQILQQAQALAAPAGRVEGQDVPFHPARRVDGLIACVFAFERLPVAGQSNL
jgi:hypothetical protein